MRTRPVFLLAFVALVLAGCAATPPPAAEPSQTPSVSAAPVVVEELGKG